MGFMDDMKESVKHSRREPEKKGTDSSLPPDYESEPQHGSDHQQHLDNPQAYEPIKQTQPTNNGSSKQGLTKGQIIAGLCLAVAGIAFVANRDMNKKDDNQVQEAVKQQAIPELQQPFTEDNLNQNFSDATQGRIKLTLNSIAIGDSGVDRGVIYQMHLNEASAQNKDVYYFNITLKNISGDEEETVHNYNFKLEDNEGNTYNDVTTRDALRGGAAIGKKVTGGISFHVNKSNYPVRLVYDTKYIVTMTGEKKFSYLANLHEIAVVKRFKGPIIIPELKDQPPPTTEKSSDLKADNWFVINGKQCKLDKGPSDMIANLQRGGLQYKVEDLKTGGGKPIIVRIDIFESLGSTSHYYYRGKETCLSEISADKKTKAAEVDKYR
jgi:hypothetical protein